jgi:hypothetical protein
MRLESRATDGDGEGGQVEGPGSVERLVLEARRTGAAVEEDKL